MLIQSYAAGLLTLLIYLPILIFIFKKDFRENFSRIVSKKTGDLIGEFVVGVLYFLIIFLSFFEETHLGWTAFVGVLFYLVGIIFTYYGYYLFFKEEGLIRRGVFLLSRNPTYFFGFVAIFGIVLMTRSWVVGILLVINVLLTHRIILNEEGYLRKVYRKEYETYVRKVRRYL